jgi:hypothetical protein
MRLQLALALASALALSSCGGPVTKATCDDAAKPAKWTATFKLDYGNADCPKLDRTVDLPGACDPGCSCSEASISFVEPSGAQQTGSCQLKLSQQCPDASSLDCRDVYLDSASHAGGECYFRGTGAAGTFECRYSTSWEKQ